MSDPHVALVAERVHAIVEDVFRALEDIRAGMEACYRSHPTFTSADLAGVRPQIFGCLRRLHGIAAGSGVIVAPGVLADRPRWLDWWQAPPDDDPIFLDVDLNPESLDFYDYTAAEWFAVPRRTGCRHVVGPYVDYGGTDTYMLTFTTPARVDGRFLGVVGADVRAARFEALLLGVLAACPTQVTLVNAEGRVVAANSPRLPAGSLLLREGAETERLPDPPWSVVSDARERAVKLA
ncbi:MULTISPECIES: PDC sensor domain-containing protein [Nonomuraea]|uniref:Cache domain-containing protein n=1 Tax=Nonomuraea mangrovi TaxID=2316207 RepID=A0ABW4SZH7_9ACTN